MAYTPEEIANMRMNTRKVPFKLRKHTPLDGWGDDAIIWRIALQYTPEWETKPPTNLWEREMKIPNGVEAEEYAKLFASAREVRDAADHARFVLLNCWDNEEQRKEAIKRLVAALGEE